MKRFLATSSRQLKNRTDAGEPIFPNQYAEGDFQQLGILTFFSTGIAWSNCLGKPSTRIKWRPLHAFSLILSWRILTNISMETSSPLCTLDAVTRSIIELETSLLNVSPTDKWQNPYLSESLRHSVRLPEPGAPAELSRVLRISHTYQWRRRQLLQYSPWQFARMPVGKNTIVWRQEFTVLHLYHTKAGLFPRHW